MRTVLVFDVDNTLAKSWKIWDEAFLRTSTSLLGQGFIMTRHPDGTDDVGFTKRSLQKMLDLRLEQLELASCDYDRFYREFDIHAEQAAKEIPTEILSGVEDFISQFFGSRMIILTSGTRSLQTAVLQSLLPYFDIRRSMFYGDHASKREALDSIAEELKPLNLVHLGDAPSDMQALRNMTAAVPKKVAVGIAITAIVTPEELWEAGADLVIDGCYSQEKADALKNLLL